MDEIAVLIPCYNESKTIEKVVKDFKAADYMDAKAARRMELFSQYAVAAAKEALEDAGLDLTKEDLFRAGVIV